MRHRAIVAAGTAAAVLAAGFLAFVYVVGPRGPRDPPQESLDREPPLAIVDVEAPSANAKNRPAAPERDGTSLREMSQGFRNSTFLIAIRRAGYYCDDVVAAHETGDGMWTASCTDVREYKVNARRADDLSVEPIYFDAPPERNVRLLERSLPAERLQQERFEQ